MPDAIMTQYYKWCDVSHQVFTNVEKNICAVRPRESDVTQPLATVWWIGREMFSTPVRLILKEDIGEGVTWH